MAIEVRRTYKYRLYTSKRDKHLIQAIDIAGIIWNHCVALQRRYYALTGEYITQGQLKRHIAKLRRQSRQYAYWQVLGSQAVQEVTERLDRASGGGSNGGRRGGRSLSSGARYVWGSGSPKQRHKAHV
ncbi:MAG: helix-turn-helix domain-containing protein [Anaerolineae bacterium]|nr:helix-turn-helix domain-containing protein [Anaerolineae bacterium]